MSRNVLGFGIALGVMLTATSALAQQPDVNPPPTGTGTAEPLPPKQPPPQPPPRSSAAAEEKKDDGITDHEKVVGKFGVGYFGISQQPLAVGAATAAGKGTVATPVIGMRYWLQERLGIDAGIGFNAFSSARAVSANNVETDTDLPAAIAFTLHAGVPLAFAYGKHYKFLIVPEVNFGYATQTEAAQNVAPGATAAPDIHRTGLRFDVGARIGTEIQFGFIGIPELALQASVGLNFQRQVWHVSQATNPETSSSLGETSFGTSVQSDPWAIFVNNIAAIYYFP